MLFTRAAQVRASTRERRQARRQARRQHGSEWSRARHGFLRSLSRRMRTWLHGHAHRRSEAPGQTPCWFVVVVVLDAILEAVLLLPAGQVLPGEQVLIPARHHTWRWLERALPAVTACGCAADCRRAADRRLATVPCGRDGSSERVRARQGCGCGCSGAGAAHAVSRPAKAQAERQPVHQRRACRLAVRVQCECHRRHQGEPHLPL